MKITKEELQVISDGLLWDNTAKFSGIYKDGALEAVALQVALLVSRTYNTRVQLNDVLDFLDFNMTVDEIEEAVIKYLND